MKILFKSKESDIISAAKKWQKDLLMDSKIVFLELKPHHSGETPEYNQVEKPTGNQSVVSANLFKDGHKYAVFKHDLFGIILARIAE